ncbi:MAG: FixH family protein [Kofleriaceae bacterium]
MKIALPVVLVLGACAGDETPNYDEQPVNCAEVTTDDELAIGLTKQGANGLLAVKFMNAEPALPEIRIDNSWVIELEAGGVPVDGATMTVSPYQIIHDHPSAKTVVVEPLPESGQYQLDKVYFTMPGLWNITFDINSAAGNDVAVLQLCFPT